MSNKICMNMVRDALRLLADASRKVEEIESVAPSDEVWSESIYTHTSLASAKKGLESLRQSLKREEEKRRKRFDSVPVLQAMLRFKDGSMRRVVVSKPTDVIDEPYIGEMFHAALVNQGVVASLEDYPILVVDRRKRIVGEISTEKK